MSKLDMQRFSGFMSLAKSRPLTGCKHSVHLCLLFCLVYGKRLLEALHYDRLAALQISGRKAYCEKQRKRLSLASLGSLAMTG